MEPVEEPFALRKRDPRTRILDRQENPITGCRHHDADLAALTCVPAGIVNENAYQAIDPFGRSIDQCACCLPNLFRRHGQLDSSRARNRFETVGAALGDRDDVYRLVSRRWGIGIKAREPQQVVDNAPEPVALAVNAFERIPISTCVTPCSEGQTDLGLDDAQWGSELMRCIGREFELATARLFDRTGGLQADQQRSKKHCSNEDRSPDQLRSYHDPLHVLRIGEALGGHKPTVGGMQSS